MLRRLMKRAMLFLCPLLVVGAAHGQLLYNQKNDDTAQQALTLAKGLATGATFDKQLDNLSRLEKLSNDRVFGGAELQMRANLLRLNTWKGAQTLINEVASRISSNQQAVTVDQYNAAKKAAMQAVGQAKSELEALDQAVKALAPAPPKEASPDAAKPASGKAKKAGAIVNDQAAAAQLQANVQAASQWLERASTAGQLLDFVQKLPAFASTAKNLPPAYLDAAKEVGNLATSLADLYKNFKITLPKSPESIPLQTHLELLQAEEDHFSNLGMIAARRDREVGDELSLIEEAQNQLNAIAKLRMPDDIADSLRKGVDAYTKAKPADKKQRSDELFTLVHCLYNTAAIASRDDTPLRLATLRLVAEEREYSIREAAIGARSYEQAIVNGVERLALYHKGGVKPQTLAQFISALATLGLIPAVLTR